MDPILATIIGGVLWLFIGGFVGAIAYMVIARIGVALSAKTENFGWAALVPIGWVIAALWWVFVIIQVIIHAVRLVQLLTGSEVTV